MCRIYRTVCWCWCICNVAPPSLQARPYVSPLVLLCPPRSLRCRAPCATDAAKPDRTGPNQNENTLRNRAISKPQKYHQLSQRALALEVLLPLVQDVAEMQGSKGLEIGAVPEMKEEDHSLLDRLEKRKALVKRSISDMTSPSFGSIFR